MNRISNYTNTTTVKIFFALSLVTSQFITLPASAGSACISQCDYDYAGETNIKAVNACKNNCSNQDARLCIDAKKDLSNAKKDLAKTCSEADMGSDCAEKVDACAEVGGSSAFATAGQYMSAIGNQYGSLVSALGAGGKGCPQMAGKTYFNRKDSLNKDIDSTKEDLAKLNDEKATIEDDFNKQIQDLQDELNKAQEELDKQKLEMKERKRKQIADFQASQNQAKEELRKKSTDLLSLRGQLISSQQDQALKLIAMSDASGKRACQKAVNDAKKAYDAIVSSGSGNYIAKAKQKKQDLISTYNDCMDSFQQQRVALNKSKKQEQDQINKAITDTQQSAEELTNSMNTASSQLAEMEQDAKTEEDAATQKVLKLMQTNQTKMLAAQQKMQSNLQTIATKNQSLSEKLNRLNNELAQLGPAPSEDSTKTVKQVGSEIGGLQENIEEAQASVDQYCGSSASSKSGGGSRRSGATK
ncbi:coiled-coil domain-containing protein [Bdellovibrio svalbardensis]|uniref:Chromosome partition protein Smc n=1 Tax=Bdellovibrio svalbardensis TaxID=2972972 RepID=A0ABT6DJ20_9BACT|nr:hypothetical protein [Bdellovibrio svalbardensis]MDG0815073.1 hypothetical protein [Bdellovibrio svalbardensis]